MVKGEIRTDIFNMALYETNQLGSFNFNSNKSVKNSPDWIKLETPAILTIVSIRKNLELNDDEITFEFLTS